MKKSAINIISAPFASFSIPSFEISSLIGYLKSKKFDVKARYIGYEYAGFLGWEDYKYLRDTAYGQKIFSMLLFDGIEMEIEEKDKLNIYRLLKLTKKFMIDYINTLSLSQEDIVIFHIYHIQTLPSLYLAKLIKNRFKCKIWFSGFHCEGDLGENFITVFNFIDDVIGVDIEESIVAKLTNKPLENNLNLDFLSSPDYDDFYEISNKLKDEIPAFRKNNVCYQVEYTRGCKWNKCSFCTLNCHTNSFRKRSKKQILSDYKTILNKYHTTLIYPEHFVMDDNWDEYLSDIFQVHKNSSKTINLNFKVSDLVHEEKFSLLRNYRANILIGTESFSSRYLKQLNKGQLVIENILVLKFAQRWGIPCFHNLIYGLPYENEEMYLESKENIEFIYHLQPPFDIEPFRLTYGAYIYENYDKYNISSVVMKKENRILFPKEILEKYIPFFYDFKVKKNSMVNDKKWEELIENWRSKFYKNEYSAIPKVEELLVTSKMDNIYQIIDRRYDTQKVYNLSNLEGEIYDFINNIRSIKEILEEFNEQEKNKILKIIDNFHKDKLIFVEDDLVLALGI